MKSISFVIPCYKSEDTIVAVVEEILTEVKKMDVDYELFLIDDCSPDNQLALFKKMAANPRIKVISFAKNFGQHAGMMAGLRVAKGDCVVILDDDGQCPMNYLGDLVAPIEEGYDAVFAGYGRQKQSLFKNLCSDIHVLATDLLTQKPKDIQMTNFIALSRIAVDEIKRYYGPYPIISGLIFRTVRRVKNVPMPERERASGSTTYNIRRLFELWLNTITAFSILPLRFGAYIGGMAAFAGLLTAGVVIFKRLMYSNALMGWTSTMAVILTLGGLILFVLGMIGEYIGRIYMSINSTPQYVIRETCNIDSHDWGDSWNNRECDF